MTTSAFIDSARRSLYPEAPVFASAKETTVSMPANERLTVPVHPTGLLPGDLLLRDPDAPEREIEWRVGRVGRHESVVVAEYVTEDGTEGTHGFEDPTVWLTVAVRMPSADGTAA